MKTYEVPVTIDIGSITRMIRVEAEDEEKALFKAIDAVDYGDWGSSTEGFNELLEHLDAIGAELDQAFVDANPATDIREVVTE